MNGGAWGGGPARFQTEKDPRAALRVPRPIDVYQVQTTAGIVFTARDDADFQIEHLVATNTTGTADYITLHIVPDGGSVGNDNMIVYQRAVPSKSGVTIFNAENMGFLQPGMTLRALCGVNDAVNLWGHGFDYQGIYGD